MELFIDECLSPRIANDLNATGQHVAQHPLHYGGRGEADHTVLNRCLVIVTQNARDFRALVGAVDLHPGLIILPTAGRDRAAELLTAAIAYLEAQGDPMELMVNHVLEVDSDGEMQMYHVCNPVKKMDFHT